MKEIGCEDASLGDQQLLYGSIPSWKKYPLFDGTSIESDFPRGYEQLTTFNRLRFTYNVSVSAGNLQVINALIITIS